MTLRTLRFDGDVHGDLASSWSFARAAATRDGLGQEVSSDEPAYAKPKLRHRWKTPSTPITGSFGQSRIAGGFDIDGVTPLSVHRSNNNKEVYIYRGYDWTVQNSFTPTVDGQTASALDFLQGSGPDNTRFAPQSLSTTGVVVCYGTIFVLVQRIESDVVQGIALIASTDYGQSWSVVEDTDGNQTFPALEPSADNGRGQIFTLQSPFPVEGTPPVDPPLELWLPFVDYTNDVGTGNKVGGQVGVVRLHRASSANHWTIDSARLVREYDTNFDSDQHVHSAGVIDRTSSGYILIASAWGDSTDDNRIELHKISLTGNDRSTYTTGAVTHNTTFHGTRDQDQSEKGSYGHQFVGCAPGPQEGELLLGGDEMSNPIVIMLAPDGDGMSENARFRHAWGGQLGNINAINSFYIVPKLPHLRKEYVAEIESGMSGSLYSPDGEHWVQLSGLRLPTWHGSEIAIEESSGIYASRVPETVIQRPLMIAPGSTQLNNGEYNSQSGPDGNNTRSTITRNGNGKFEFPAGHPRAGEELPEQPPTTADELLHCQVVDTDGLGQIRLSTFDGTNRGDGDLIVCLMALEHGGGGAAFRVSPGGGGGNAVEAITVETETWYQAHVFDDTNLGGIVGMTINGASGSDYVPSEFLLGVVNVHENGATEEPAYPMPTTSSSTGTSHPDQIAKISGISVGDTWTVAAFAQRPEQPWTLGALSDVPLISIVEDSSNYVTVTVDSSGGDITATLDVTTGGTSTTATTSAAGEWSPDCMVSAVVSRLPNGSTELRLVGNDTTIVSATVADEITGTSVDVKCCNDDETTVGRFDFWQLVVEDTRALSSAQKDRLAFGERWRDSSEVPSAAGYI